MPSHASDGVVATVLVPTTGDRAPLLRYSLASVLRQSVRELELFVLGDGIADPTRAFLNELCASDARVRLFDHPKHPRRGEPHRHAALAEARGRIVCYLTDRDLMLPHHVEEMAALLRDADFAHTLPVGIRPDGRLDLRRALEADAFRERPVVRRARVPLSFAGHTFEIYRRLPHGWRETPREIPTDQYMWEQILRHPGCRVAAGTRPTLLYFKRFGHPGWSVERRRAELEVFHARLAQPGFARAFERRVRRAWGPQRLRYRVARGVDVLRGSSRRRWPEVPDAEVAPIQRHLRLEVYWRPASGPGARVLAYGREVVRLEGEGNDRRAALDLVARVERELTHDLAGRLARSRRRRVRAIRLDPHGVSHASAWMEARLLDLASARDPGMRQ